MTLLFITLDPTINKYLALAIIALAIPAFFAVRQTICEVRDAEFPLKAFGDCFKVFFLLPACLIIFAYLILWNIFN